MSSFLKRLLGGDRANEKPPPPERSKAHPPNPPPPSPHEPNTDTQRKAELRAETAEPPVQNEAPQTRDKPGATWPPHLVMFATWDSHCDFCGKELLTLRDRISPSDHYGWIHYSCASTMSSESDRPHDPIELVHEPPVEYACQGWMPRKKQQCLKTTTRPPLDAEGAVLDYYCRDHTKQRPDDAPDIAEPEAPAPSLSTWSLAGESFADGYPDGARRIADALAATDGQAEAIPALLVRDPDSEFDSNEVEVHVPMLNQIVGHLSRRDAAEMAPKLDSGETWHVWITAVTFVADNLDTPGLRASGYCVRKST